MPTALRTLLLLLLASVLAGGCGSMSHDDYQRELRSIGSDITRSLDHIPRGQSDVSASQLARLADALRTSAADLDGLNGPDETDDPQNDMVRGLRDAATVLDRLAARLDGADTGNERADLYVEFSTDASAERAFSRIDRAQRAYVKAGYRIFDARPGVP